MVLDIVNDEFEKIEGKVITIYEDFLNTGDLIIKERAVAFLLDTDKNGKFIVIYDKNALKLGLIKVGEPLTCLGSCGDTIVAIDSNGKIAKEKMFLCRGIMGSADINEEELIKQGAVKL